MKPIVLEFDQERLRTQLARLSPAERLLFSALCSERCVPPFLHLERRSPRFDTLILRKALESAFSMVTERYAISEGEIHQLIQDCEQMLPDRNEFPESWVTQGLYAVSALVYTLQLALDGSEQTAILPAQLAVESAYLFAMSELAKVGMSDLPVDQIIGHPALQLELRRQQEDLEAIQGATNIDVEALSHLRARNQGAYVQLALE